MYVPNIALEYTYTKKKLANLTVKFNWTPVFNLAKPGPTQTQPRTWKLTDKVTHAQEHKHTHAHAHIQTQRPCSIRREGESKGPSEGPTPHASLSSVSGLKTSRVPATWGPLGIQVHPGDEGALIQHLPRPRFWAPAHQTQQSPMGLGKYRQGAGGSRAGGSSWSPPAGDLLRAPSPFVCAHRLSPRLRPCHSVTH